MTSLIQRRFPAFLCLIALVWMPTTIAEPQVDLDQKIDLSLNDASLVETLESFATISGSQLDVAPGVDGVLNLKLKNTQWLVVLGMICEENALNCEMLSGEPSILRVRPTAGATGAASLAGYAQAIDIALRGGDLRETLRTFTIIGGREVIVDDAVTGKLTIELRHAPWTVVLEEACNLSGCRIEWAAETIRVLPSDKGTDRRTSMSLRGASTIQVLESLVEIPIFGPLGHPELVLQGELEPTIDLELKAANWLEALNAVCDAAYCKWEMTYGSPSQLRIEALSSGPDQRVELPTEPVDLSEAVDLLANALDVAGELLPAIDPLGPVRFSARELSWKDAAREMCEQTNCYWSLHDGRLIVRPRVAVLTDRPRASVEDREVGFVFRAPGAEQPVTGTASFNWAVPIRTFEDASGKERWLARLSWIPFGPELQVVVPTLLHCTKGAASVSLLDPVMLPIDEPQRQEHLGAVVELSNPDKSRLTDKSRLADVNGRAKGCSEKAPGKASVALRGLDSAAEPAVLSLELRVGSYLLISPPGAERSEHPLAAVLVAGVNSRGEQELALITARDGNVDVALVAVPTGGQVEETLRAPDGSDLLLTLHHEAPALDTAS